jgi:hypothetical protein
MFSESLSQSVKNRVKVFKNCPLLLSDFNKNWRTLENQISQKSVERLPTFNKRRRWNDTAMIRGASLQLFANKPVKVGLIFAVD